MSFGEFRQEYQQPGAQSVVRPLCMGPVIRKFGPSARLTENVDRSETFRPRGAGANPGDERAAPSVIKMDFKDTTFGNMGMGVACAWGQASAISSMRSRRSAFRSRLSGHCQAAPSETQAAALDAPDRAQLSMSGRSRSCRRWRCNPTSRPGSRPLPG